MNEGLIPRRYAKALYLFAEEKGKQQHVYEVMLTLEKSFALTPGLASTLNNPFVSVDEKLKLITTAANTDNADTAMSDFLKLLTRNDRLSMIRDIAIAYATYYRMENNIYVVKVTSASALNEQEQSRIKAMVLRHLDGGTIEYSSEVDSSLIGGFTVSVGNDRIDASISNELKQLRLNLLSK